MASLADNPFTLGGVALNIHDSCERLEHAASDMERHLNMAPEAGELRTMRARLLAIGATVAKRAESALAVVNATPYNENACIACGADLGPPARFRRCRSCGSEHHHG